MKDYGSKETVWEAQADAVGDAVKHDISSQQELIDFVKDNGCCTLYTFGHQGGGDVGNVGGTTSFPNGHDAPVFIIPSTNHKGKHKDFFELLFSHCDNCFLNIVACGGDSEEHQSTRQNVADKTGCTVCGSTDKITIVPPEGDIFLTNGTEVTVASRPDIKPWDPTCVSPSK